MKTQKISSTDKMTDLSLMRVIACLGIVILHTVFAADEYFAAAITPGQHLISRIVENNMMWAVPTFLMVTGSLQLDTTKELTLSKLYKKYVLRILIALVACCILFRIFDMIMDGEAFTFAGVMVAFKEMFIGKAWGHLWYLYLLIGLYVLLPFYRKITRFCTDRELLYLAWIYFIFVSIVPTIEAFGVPVAFYIGESLIYPLYMLLGYLIHRGRFKIGAGMGLVLMVAGTAAIVIMDFEKYGASVDIPAHMFGYSSPVVVIQTIGVFALVCGGREALKSLLSAKPTLAGFISMVDAQAFGIYLIHMVFVRLLFKYWMVNPYEYGGGALLIAIVPGIFILSLMITWVLRKIPAVRKVL